MRTLSHTANNSRLTEVMSSAFSLAASIVSQTADAHDVIQDAAITALTHANAPVQDSCDFRPWFYKVVRNKAIDKVRQDKRYKAQMPNGDTLASFDNTNARPALDSLIADQQKSLEADLQRSEAHKRLFDALSRVSIEHREIVLLKDYYGFAYADIANILSIEKGTVMSRLHRARQALQQKLNADTQQTANK